MKSRWIKSTVVAAIAAAGMLTYFTGFASDHDDGSQATAVNNLNLTDLFVFREDNQTSNPADRGNLVLIMNSNGHTPAGQQVFFNTGGRYDFHITRVPAANVNMTPTGTEDVRISFTFGEPDVANHQSINMTLVIDGASQPVDCGGWTTTSLADGKAGNLKINCALISGQTVSVFAGLREDPFFFDVEQFFKVRAGALGQTPEVGFKPPNTAVDGFANQNINSIAVRVPITLLQTAAAEPVFDVWETTSKL